MTFFPLPCAARSLDSELGLWIFIARRKLLRNQASSRQICCE
jgi:hypothetical protein